MALEMSQFHEAFFGEAFESLDAMEKSLLELDPGAPNAETINSIFRVAHSIKGGSGMFGFNHIAAFTHTLETLLDELRAGRMAVTADIIDLLLKSTDILRSMLQATQQSTPVDEQAVADVQFDLEVLVAKGREAATAEPVTAATESIPDAPGAAAIAPAPATTDARVRWQICCKPNARMLLLGNDALRLLEDLSELGELQLKVDTSAVPELSALDPEVCYLSWQAELHTERDEAAIRAVFEWVESDCELQIGRLEASAAAAAADAIATPPMSAVSAPPPRPTVLAADALTSATSAPALGAAAPATGKEAVAKPAARPGPVAVASPEKSAKSAAGDANSIRVSIDKIDELMNTVGEIVITQSMLTQLAATVDAPRMDRVRNGLAQLERHVRELQESVMRVRMLPISFAFSRFPRLVRDLSQRLGKQIELKMTGEQTELDKTVLERIGDPLVHLVRNSIDHGIEMPASRPASRQPARCTSTRITAADPSSSRSATTARGSTASGSSPRRAAMAWSAPMTC